MPDAIAYLTTHYKRTYADSYQITERQGWTYFIPSEQYVTPDQGWKVHISVDLPVVAPTIALIGDRLCREKVYWKTCPSLDAARRLCSVPTPLSQVGKLITIYPRDEHHTQQLLSWLYPLLRGLPGPVIPSDIQFRQDAPIFLRYGSFKRNQMYDLKTAVKTPYLVRPDGQRVPDSRTVGTSHPVWQPLPNFLAANPSSAQNEQQNPGDGLFGREIYVISALRQSAKGGVYLCEYKGQPAVLKEGRHGTTPDMQGRDSVARIQNEYACLQQLRPTQIAPEPYELFREENNVYILMEYIEGQSLRTTVESWNYFGQDDPTPIRNVCDNLIRMVGTAHKQRVRIRDLTPNNIMMTASGCRLVDLELGFLIDGDEHPFHGQTFGYVPSGHETTPRVAKAYDYYALGKVLLFILLGFDVARIPDAVSLRRMNKYPELQDLLDQALMWVVGFDGPPDAPPEGFANPLADAGHQLDLARKLLREAAWDEEYLWTSYTNATYSPICLYSGAAGVAWFLYQLYLATGNSECLFGAKRLLDWGLDTHPFVGDAHPTGLFFGYGAMPLLMSALHHSQPDLFAVEDIVSLILALLSDNRGGYDVTHGMAGIGIAALNIATMIPEVAPTITHKLEPLGRTILKHLDSPSSQQSFGFAHGLSGIGYFFLLLYGQTAWAWAAEVADRIAHEILGAKIITTDGSYMWPKSRHDSTAWTHWCHGSAGVGTFLLSAGHILGSEAFKIAGLRAAAGIARHHGFGSISLCHGFPGDFDFILDVIRTHPSDDFDRYKERVLTMLQGTLDHRHLGDSLWLWASEGGTQLAPSLMTGYVGVHSMLIRATYPNIPRLCGVLAPNEGEGDLTWLSM